MNDLLTEIIDLRDLLRQPCLADKPAPAIASPDAFKSVRLMDKVIAVRRLIEIRRELEELANG